MKKLITLTVAGMALAGTVGLSSVSAIAQYGQPNGSGAQVGSRTGYGYQASLESRAEVFGMEAEELQQALQTKTMSQIAVERGMDEDAFRTKMTEATEARWKARGLSAEEVAGRIAERDARHAASSTDHEFGSGEGNHQGGYGHRR